MTDGTLVVVPSSKSTTIREEWLAQAVGRLTDLLNAVGEDVPPIHISVGFPGGRSNRQVTIGQCWAKIASEDGVNQIFISPIRGSDQTVGVLGTILHEMVHAVDDCESGHKGNFLRIAKALGFIAKFTSSDNRDEELEVTLRGIAEELGPFPHPQLGGDGGGSETPKKQESRQLKAECPNGSGYKVRLSRKWIDEVGAPICPCCQASMEVEEK